MRALTFQAACEVRVEERPMPEIQGPDDCVVRVDASGAWGSDLHIYHGRLSIEPGFTIGHEYVGTVVEAGSQVTRVSVGDRVAGCFLTACGAGAASAGGGDHPRLDARARGKRARAR